MLAHVLLQSGLGDAVLAPAGSTKHGTAHLVYHLQCPVGVVGPGHEHRPRSGCCFAQSLHVFAGDSRHVGGRRCRCLRSAVHPQVRLSVRLCGCEVLLEFGVLLPFESDASVALADQANGPVMFGVITR